MTSSRRPALAWALMGLLLVAPCCACARPTPTPQPVTITFAYLDQDTAYYEALAEAFNRAHANVTIKLLPKRWEALNNLGPGDGDVFVAPYSLRQRLERGDILSLEVWLAADESFDKADFYPGTLALFTREGKTWGIPAGMDLVMMYYNKDLFDERQLPYPQAGWTWEDFLNTAVDLRDYTTGVYGYAAGASQQDAALFVFQHGGRLVDDWQNPTRTTFDDPLTIEALEWYAGLIYEHGVAPTPEEARQAFGGGEYALYSGVLAGKVGLWPDMYSSRGGRTWPRKWEFGWGLTTLPRDREAATLALVEALAISAEAQQPEACWQWVAFLSRQTPSRLAPVRRSVAESAAYEQQVGADVAAAVRASVEHAILIPPDLMEQYEKLGRLWAKAVDEILSGKSSAREALTRAQQEADK